MLSKKEIYAQALRILEQRREQTRLTAENHLLEACTRAPEISQLKKKLGQTSIQLAKAILSHQGNTQAILEQIEQENILTQQRIKQVLVEHHLPEDYLEEKPNCTKCQDTGYCGRKQCQCLRDIIIRISAEELQKNTQLKLKGFENFQLYYYSKIPEDTGVSPYDHMGRILQYCKRYAEQFEPHTNGIFMSGKTGLGKTHLSLAIAQRVLQRGYTVIYSSVSEIVRKISTQYFGREQGNQSEDIFEILNQVDLLILDDLGAEFESSFSTSAIYDLINARISAGRPTIISTNLTPTELQKRYSERIVSRLFTQLTPLNFIGQDVRTKLAADNKKF
ncbi:ATP-binding protein [Clostridium facile]|uniref:ATP-binding protein n=1 Tax=Clostridium facile TaxID=2763035 RepID=A0ABR7IPX5_9CLOT|nr:ATP-binding protein [Clostridium facile]MBC5787178.1 ATP-binding protein [Clostridium facile]PWN00227.1 MAG: DNA replication protein DnaC [Massilioclostridium sp.]